MDREKVVKGLECCKRLFPERLHCSECPYDKICYHEGRCGTLLSDALELLKEQKTEISKISKEYLELVGKASKQPQIVRYKDCKHNHDKYCPTIGVFVTDDWFCADGERKDT